MAAEVTFALKSLEEIKAGLTSAGQAAVIARREAEQAKKAAQNAGEGSKDNVTEVFAQLLGLAAKKGNSGHPPAPLEPRHEEARAVQARAPARLRRRRPSRWPRCPWRASSASSTLPFAKLVGYQEHEFGKAAWPSPHDRSVYEQQQEQLSQLASGEIESVTVQSTYMHGQGLMVPVVGKLSVVPGEDGLPLHLLLEAEDRHTTLVGATDRRTHAGGARRRGSGARRPPRRSAAATAPRPRRRPRPSPATAAPAPRADRSPSRAGAASPRSRRASSRARAARGGAVRGRCARGARAGARSARRRLVGCPRWPPAPHAARRAARRRRGGARRPRAARARHGGHGRPPVAALLALVLLAVALYALNATFQPFHGDGRGRRAGQGARGRQRRRDRHAARGARRGRLRDVLPGQRDRHRPPRQAAPGRLHAAARA